MENIMLTRLARTCYRHRRIVLSAWILLFVAAIAAGTQYGGKAATNAALPGTDSQRAADLLRSQFPQRAGDSGTIVFAGLPGHGSEIAAYVASVRHLPGVTEVDPLRVAPDGRVAIAALTMADSGNARPALTASRMEALAGPLRRAGVDVQFSGDWFATGGLPSTEAIGILAACIVLLLAFGSVVAMGLPIGTALIGLGVTVAEVALVSRFVTTPGFATQVAAMIGIGVGIDYALLIVTRYRDSLRRTHDPESAVVEALSTAGRAVVFAGCTVVISLMGIYLMGLRYLDGLAVGASLGVAIAVLAAVTLLPALLGFVGPGIDRLRVKRPSSREGAGMWERWARFVQRRPLPLALGALGVLLVAAIPVFAIHLGFADAGNDAPSSTTRQAFDLVGAGFGPGANGPIVVVADLRTPGATSALPRLVTDLRSASGVAGVADPVTSPSGGAAVVTLTPTTGPQDQATIRLLHHLRDSVIPSAVKGTGMHVYVGGETAGNIDFAALMARRLPFFLIGVLTLSFLLLLVVFRSVLVPLKAVLMNLLSIGTAYGAMVAVFQWGWGGSHLGITGAPIEAWAPMMLFAIVFGLSMDYEVFLLSAIKEHYDATGDNGWAVASGLASTARVITAAATVMVVVFGSFLLSDARSLKEIGLGLALAIAVDATLVRVVLVPATMELLGRANWWFPAWLERLVPRLRIDHGTDDVSADRPQVPASVS
jgi:putative drug exporter of the RND superfamily